MRLSKGFTLLELIIVVAIVGILVVAVVGAVNGNITINDVVDAVECQ